MEQQNPLISFLDNNVNTLNEYYGFLNNLDNAYKTSFIRNYPVWFTLNGSRNFSLPVLYLTTKLYHRNYDLWEGLNTPNVRISKDRLGVTFIRTNTSPKRDESTLRQLRQQLKYKFKDQIDVVNTPPVRLGIKIGIIRGDQQEEEEEEDHLKIDIAEQIVIFAIAYLIKLDIENKMENINSCIVCGDAATRWVEDNHEIKVCEKQMCELKI